MSKYFSCINKSEAYPADQRVYGKLKCVFMCTVIASSVGLPVRSAEMSGFGGLDYDVLNISPC